MTATRPSETPPEEPLAEVLAIIKKQRSSPCFDADWAKVQSQAEALVKEIVRLQRSERLFGDEGMVERLDAVIREFAEHAGGTDSPAVKGLRERCADIVDRIVSVQAEELEDPKLIGDIEELRRDLTRAGVSSRAFPDWTESEDTP